MIRRCGDSGHGDHDPVCSWEFPGSLKHIFLFVFVFFKSIFRKHAFRPGRAHTVSVHVHRSPLNATWMRTLLGFMAVQVFESFQFLNESFVLVLQNSHAVLQTLDVFLLLPAALSGRLPGDADEALISVD